MRYGLSVPNFGAFADPHAFVQLATAAEAGGWDGVYIWDHIVVADGMDVADPWVCLAAAAAVTERVRLGPLVTPLPRRYPWSVAREVTTLDWLSGGRITLGVGIGSPPEEEFGTFGLPTDARTRADLLDEALEVIEGMWAGEPFSHAGQHYVVKETRFGPGPVQRPRPPIWVAGAWPARRPFRRAARFDGVFPLKRGDDGRELVPLGADDLADVVAYVGEHRGSGEAFDVIVTDVDAPDVPIAELADIGVTWMLSYLFAFDDAAQAMVAAGPTRL